MAEQQHEKVDASATPPIFIKQTEAARRLSVSLREFQRWTKDGRVAVYRPSARLALVEWAEVERMIRDRRQVVACA